MCGTKKKAGVPSAQPKLQYIDLIPDVKAPDNYGDTTTLTGSLKDLSKMRWTPFNTIRQKDLVSNAESFCTKLSEKEFRNITINKFKLSEMTIISRQAVANRIVYRLIHQDSITERYRLTVIRVPNPYVYWQTLHSFYVMSRLKAAGSFHTILLPSTVYQIADPFEGLRFVIVEDEGRFTLREILDAHKALKIKPFAEEIAIVTKDLLDTVAFLDKSGFAHRDIKPENIIFKADNLSKFSVIGWDVAIAFSEGKMKPYTNQPLPWGGTPKYMAPELLKSHRNQSDAETDPIKSDLYSIGLIQAEMNVISNKLLVNRGNEAAFAEEARRVATGADVANLEQMKKLLADSPQGRGNVSDLSASYGNLSKDNRSFIPELREALDKLLAETKWNSSKNQVQLLYTAYLASDFNMFITAANLINSLMNSMEATIPVSSPTAGADKNQLLSLRIKQGEWARKAGFYSDSMKILSILPERGIPLEDRNSIVSNLAYAYIGQGLYSKAIQFLQEEIASRNIAQDECIVHIMYLLGKLCIIVQDEESAGQMFEGIMAARKKDPSKVPSDIFVESWLESLFLSQKKKPLSEKELLEMKNQADKAFGGFGTGWAKFLLLNAKSELAAKRKELAANNFSDATNMVADLYTPASANYADIVWKKALIKKQMGDYNSAFHDMNVVMNAFTSLYKSDAHVEVANVNIVIGNWKAETKNWKQAKEFYLGAEKILKQSLLGENSLEVAKIHEVIGEAYFGTQDYQEALQYWESSLSIKENLTRPNDTEEVAISLRYIARALIELNRLEDAKKCLDRAIEVFQRTNDNLEIARTFEIYGLREAKRNDLDKALEHLQRAEKLREGIQDEESYNLFLMIGDVHLKQFSIGDAQHYYSKALDIATKTEAGWNYSDVYDRYGDSYITQSIFSNAGTYYFKGYELRKAYLEKERIAEDQLAISETKLGTLSELQGDDAKANEYYDLAMRRRIKFGGEEQRTVVELLTLKAGIAVRRNDLKQAEELSAKAVRIGRNLQNAQRELSDALLARGLVLNEKKGKYDDRETIALYEECLTLKTAMISGKETSIQLDSCLNYLGTACIRSGFPQRAIECLEILLKNREAIYGDNTKEVAETNNDLGGAYLLVGRYSDAVEKLESALEYRTNKMGSEQERRDLATTQYNLACAYCKSGRIADAQRLHKESLRSRAALVEGKHTKSQVVDVIVSNVGISECYWKNNQKEEALSTLKSVLENFENEILQDGGDPCLVDLNYYSGLIEVSLGRVREGKDHLQQALTLAQRYYTRGVTPIIDQIEKTLNSLR